MTVADQIFAARAEYRAVGERTQAAILTALGLDPDAPGEWPHERIEYDDRERSWTLTEVTPGWMPTQEQRDAATRGLGFRCGWLWYAGNPVAGLCEPTEG